MMMTIAVPTMPMMIMTAVIATIMIVIAIEAD